MFFPYLVGLSVVLMTSTQKPVNSGSDGISDEWNILEASVGTEELGHLEMVGTIVHQLTRNLTEKQIEENPGFASYFIDHTTGVYPTAASGFPWSAASIQSTGDPIADLNENLAAEQKARITYDNILRLVDDPDVIEPIKFLRQREIVHYQRFGDTLPQSCKLFA